MNKMILFLVLVLGNNIILPQHSRHSAEVKNEIKSLSSEQINGYLNGEGMGLAKAAELNHYPGPKHVLEFSDELKLTDEQKSETKDLISEMKNDAVFLGNQIVEKEKTLDILFKNGNAEEKAVQSLLLEIAELNGELRFVHIKAHVRQQEILTDDQIKLYDKLREYD